MKCVYRGNRLVYFAPVAMLGIDVVFDRSL